MSVLELDDGDGLETPRGGMDKAIVTIVSQLDAVLYSQTSECFHCPLVRRTLVSSHQNKSLEFATQFSHHIVVNKTVASESSVLCESTSVHFADGGRYLLNIDETTKGDCVWTALNSPPDSNIPVYVALGVIVGISLLWILIKYLYSRGVFNRILPCLQTEHLVNDDLGSPLLTEDGVPSFTGSAVRTSRICAVDTFRGLSLIIMVFVNYGGGGYWYFQHASWNGLTVADLVFPWFVFLMGTSIAVSFRSAVRRGTSRLTLMYRVVRRTIILFLLGLAVSNHGRDIYVSQLRIFGVLQKLSLTYFVVSVFEVFTAIPADPHTHKWWRGFRELVVSWPTWLLAVVMVVVYVGLTFFLEVPGCGRGYLGPGGLHENRLYENCTGGAAGYIDRVILSNSHIYTKPTCMTIYECTIPYDPEGILGLTTSIVLCILGLQAGKILITYQTPKGLMHRWVIWGVATGLLAGALCMLKKDDGPIPINKNLWSLSFALAMAGSAYLLLAFLYFIIDECSAWSGAPFVYPGMNSILIYMCHEVFHDYFPIHFHVPPTHAAQLALDIWGTVFWIIVAAILHYKRIFVAV
jgi:heparan-alpha-glucosaminide N-acetyltransferase